MSTRVLAALQGLVPAALLLSLALPAFSAEPSAKSFTIASAQRAPVVDGVFDPEEWQDATRVDDFHQIAPVEFSVPSQRTEVYVKYDADTLYVGARLLDDVPGGVTANVMRQGENLQDDDSFGVVLSPFADDRTGYWFELNANGVRRQAIFQDVENRNFDWRGIWHGMGGQDAHGWVAEFAIPMKTLAFPPTEAPWGVSFRRKIERTRESMGWTSRNRRFHPGATGRMAGLRGLEQGRGLDVVPSLSVRNDRRFGSASDERSLEPSLDVFYKITPAITAALSINTDFSATDVDDRQVNLTRFGLFFPEKRAFFLQDADIFDFGRLTSAGNDTELPGSSLENGRPFFSRRIGLSGSGQPVDLHAGVKVAGREGPYSLGVLGVRQAEAGNVNSQDLLVLRGAARVFEGTTVGAILTRGDPRSNRDNLLGGVDVRYRNPRVEGVGQVVGEAWLQQSDTPGRSGNDVAWGVRLDVPNDEGWRAGASVKSLGRNFLPALGFVNNVGIRESTLHTRYTYNADGFVQSAFATFDLQHVELLGDGLQSRVVTLRPIVLELSSGEVVDMLYARNTEVLDEPFEISRRVVLQPGRYTFDELGASIDTAGRRAVSVGLVLAHGDFYGGTRTRMDASMTWRPSPHFAFTARYEHFDVDLPEGDFTTRVMRARMDVVFSSRLSWSNLLQYDDDSEVLGINSRVQWIPESGRELFVVLNHAIDDVDRDERFHSRRSEAVVKLGYTLRF